MSNTCNSCMYFEKNRNQAGPETYDGRCHRCPPAPATFSYPGSSMPSPTTYRTLSHVCESWQ
jgi:hypothetical protein